MGRKTLATFPGGKCLPGRRNVVLTSDISFAAPDAVVVHSLPEAMAAAGEDAFCIGGESVYRQFLPYCGEVWLTQVLAAPADCFFPLSGGLCRGQPQPRPGKKTGFHFSM